MAITLYTGNKYEMPADLEEVTIGVRWAKDKFDIDLSALLFRGDRMCVDHVSFQNLSSVENGIKHSGDSRTGGATCDDETIQVQLSQVREDVQRIVFVANVFTDGCSFANVSNGSCRVVDADRELCRYSLSDYDDENGLVIASLDRAQGRWEFHAIGNPCRGRKWRDSLLQIEQICFDGATQNRSFYSSQSFSGGDDASARRSNTRNQDCSQPQGSGASIDALPNEHACSPYPRTSPLVQTQSPQVVTSTDHCAAAENGDADVAVIESVTPSKKRSLDATSLAESTPAKIAKGMSEPDKDASPLVGVSQCAQTHEKGLEVLKRFRLKHGADLCVSASEAYVWRFPEWGSEETAVVNLANNIPKYGTLQSEEACDGIFKSAYAASFRVAKEREIKYLGVCINPAGNFQGYKPLPELHKIVVQGAIENAYEGLREIHLIGYCQQEVEELGLVAAAVAGSASAGKQAQS